MNTTEAMLQLQKRRQELVDIAQDVAPPAKNPLPPEKTYEFYSRKHIEEKILSAFTEGNAIVGIKGMGGLGKTVMANRIKHRMMAEKLVDEVVMVIVSQPVDILKIQLHMGEQLNLKEIENQQTIDARAQKLHTRLKSSKQVLIVLDDIWQELNLVKLGIPNKTDYGSCFVLLTSRKKDELRKMNARVFEIPFVNDGEALSFFKEKAKISEKDKSLMPLAKEIVDKCQGLPLALVTIGTSLIERGKRVWKDALHQLKASNPSEILECLRVSYDLLEKDETKELFLLCSLYPEDYSIKIEDLTFYSMGLQIFQNVDTLDQARNRAWSLVTILKNCSLLLDAEKKDRVRMHDIIRDLAISIASEKQQVAKTSLGKCDKNCEWISEFPNSSNDSLDHLMGSEFPKLRLMMIHGNYFSKPAYPISFLQGKESLNVLALENFTFKDMPQRVELPKSLHTLCLVDCNLRSISAVGKLLNLEILVFKGCKHIKELPVEIGELRCLKLLDLSKCRMLQRIVPGIIKKLVQLEELKMLQTFTGWESSRKNENEIMNASLKELESLINLTCLEIQISNLNLVEEQIQLPPSLETYKIVCGCFHDERNIDGFEMHDRVAAFDGSNQVYDAGSWILTYARKAEGLYLYQNGPRNFNPLEAHSTVKRLSVKDCEMFETLVKTSAVTTDGAFPDLEYLLLENLPKLMHIFDGPISRESTSLKKLRKLVLINLPSLTHFLENANQNISLLNLGEIEISRCDELRNFFLMVTAGEVFSRLEKLKIMDCEKMEYIMGNQEDMEEGTREGMVHFQNLKELVLYNLPSMTTFGKSIESIEFHSLLSLRIKKCPKLTNFVSIDEHNHGGESFHLFCHSQVKFDILRNLGIGGYDRVTNVWCQHISKCFFATLESLDISELDNIKGLFSSSIANSLVNLKKLWIESCKNMKRVIMDENGMHKDFDEIEEEGRQFGGTTSHVTFPKLLHLTLWNLENLTGFGGIDIESISFPLLERVNVYGCPKFKHMVTSFENEDGHDLHDDANDESLHLFCNEKVKFDRLKDLTISEVDDVTNVWCQHISTCFFTTLEEFWIDSLNNIGGLFSSSIANSLVNLKILRIRSCKNMERIIVDEKDIQKRIGEMEEGKENEETRGHITFPKLEYLELDQLESLSVFCGNGIESIYFPLLVGLCIEGCPQFAHMIASSKSEDGHDLHDDGNDDESLHLFCNKKMFLTSNSIVSTPNLEKMKLDGKYYEKEAWNEMGLNAFIHQHNVSKQKESTSYGDKPGYEEMETPALDSNIVADSVEETGEKELERDKLLCTPQATEMGNATDPCQMKC